ncbi:nicotinic acid mononucleotide adenylyltransferase, partial [gut metagenome]
MSASGLRRGLGILGGTFDPVHTGHLALAKTALQAMPLTRVELLPAGEPWQKSGISPGLHRLN